MLYFVRAAWGGEEVEEVEQDVCGLSPSSACATMQPGPSAATPAAAERPKRSPSPVSEVRFDTQKTLIQPAADQRMSDSTPTPDVLVGIVILEAPTNFQR